MPAGAGTGAGVLLSTVGRKRSDAAASVTASASLADGLWRVTVNAVIPATATVAKATNVHALPSRRGEAGVLIDFERRLLICGAVDRDARLIQQFGGQSNGRRDSTVPAETAWFQGADCCQLWLDHQIR